MKTHSKKISQSFQTATKVTAELNSYRVERVNEAIRRELIILLKHKTKDPRLVKVMITDVVASRDLSTTKVFYTVADKDKITINDLLDKASGFFRSHLSNTVKLRHIPKLRFIFDPAPDTGAKIEYLLSNL